MAHRIRLAHDADAAPVAAIYGPIVEQTAISFETVAPAAEEMRRRIIETLETYPWLVCEIDGRIAGYAYAAKHRTRGAYRWSVDSTVYVDPAFRRLGVGHGLYVSLFAILAQQGYVNAYAGIALPNEASVALHETLGFESVGIYRRVGFKHGAWHDVGWWALALNEHVPSPAEPAPVPTVAARPGWPAILGRGEPIVRSRAG